MLIGTNKKTEILIHIGYHKTSTTWFQKFLFNNSAIRFILPWRNPEILPVLVYPHALDFVPHVCRKYFQPAILDAQNCGLIPALSSEELSGNPHCGGYASKELADRLAVVFPEARILIVIREQKDMIVSTYKQYVKVGGIDPLVDYLQPPNRGKERLPLFDWEHFKYHRLIRYYLNFYGYSQVLVLPYELFRDHPFEFISQIIRFCELEIKAEIIESLPYARKKNESLSGISTALKRHVNRIVSPRDHLNSRALIPVTTVAMNQKLKSYWQTLDAIIPSFLKKTSENKLKTIVSELTGDRYKQSNTLTAEMLNLDLSKYGYDL